MMLPKISRIGKILRETTTSDTSELSLESAPPLNLPNPTAIPELVEPDNSYPPENTPTIVESTLIPELEEPKTAPPPSLPPYILNLISDNSLQLETSRADREHLINSIKKLLSSPSQLRAYIDSAISDWRDWQKELTTILNEGKHRLQEAVRVLEKQKLYIQKVSGLSLKELVSLPEDELIEVLNNPEIYNNILLHISLHKDYIEIARTQAVTEQDPNTTSLLTPAVLNRLLAYMAQPSLLTLHRVDLKSNKYKLLVKGHGYIYYENLSDLKVNDDANAPTTEILITPNNEMPKETTVAVTLPTIPRVAAEVITPPEKKETLDTLKNLETIDKLPPIILGMYLGLVRKEAKAKNKSTLEYTGYTEQELAELSADNAKKLTPRDRLFLRAYNEGNHDTHQQQLKEDTIFQRHTASCPNNAPIADLINILDNPSAIEKYEKKANGSIYIEHDGCGNVTYHLPHKFDCLDRLIIRQLLIRYVDAQNIEFKFKLSDFYKLINPSRLIREKKVPTKKLLADMQNEFLDRLKKLSSVKIECTWKMYEDKKVYNYTIPGNFQLFDYHFGHLNGNGNEIDKNGVFSRLILTNDNIFCSVKMGGWTNIIEKVPQYTYIHKNYFTLNHNSDKELLRLVDYISQFYRINAYRLEADNWLKVNVNTLLENVMYENLTKANSNNNRYVRSRIKKAFQRLLEDLTTRELGSYKLPINIFEPKIPWSCFLAQYVYLAPHEECRDAILRTQKNRPSPTSKDIASTPKNNTNATINTTTKPRKTTTQSNMITKNLGPKIRTARESYVDTQTNNKGITLRRLAELVSALLPEGKTVSYEKIRRWETVQSTPTKEELEVLLKVLPNLSYPS